MDAVYPLGKGSVWGNREIHYSTRLLRKNTAIQNIFTIGEAYDGCENIPYEDKHEKVVNLWEKCYLACSDPRISDPFLFINDDHYIIKPVDIENYPNYYSYNISQYPYQTFRVGNSVVDKHSHPYWNLVWNTNLILGDVLFFNVHCPVLIHKQKFIDVFEKHYENVYAGKLLLKTTYLQGESGVQMDDYKTRRRETLASITHNCKDRHVFSSGDEADNCAEFLELMLKV